MFNAIELVDYKNVASRSADRCAADQFSPAPLEMFVPLINAGIEKSCDLPGIRINARNVRTFVGVAVKARKLTSCPRWTVRGAFER